MPSALRKLLPKLSVCCQCCKTRNIHASYTITGLILMAITGPSSGISTFTCYLISPRLVYPTLVCSGGRIKQYRDVQMNVNDDKRCNHITAKVVQCTARKWMLTDVQLDCSRTQQTDLSMSLQQLRLLLPEKTKSIEEHYIAYVSFKKNTLYGSYALKAWTKSGN